MDDEFSDRRARASEAVDALIEHLKALLVCSDILAAAGHDVAAREARRALMRGTAALHVLRDELATIEIVEAYLRAHAQERDRPPLSSAGAADCCTCHDLSSSPTDPRAT